MTAGDVGLLRARLSANEVIGRAELALRDPGWEPANLDAFALVRPRFVADIQGLLAWCRETGRTIVPQGGRTGLVGGSVASPRQVICDLGAMDAIEDIDGETGVAVVQAGVTLGALQDAAAAFGLDPGIDLAARGSATVGGLISTNAGGIAAFRSGVMRHRVLGLEVVLPDGRVVTDLTRVIKTSAGYDLKQLFIGAEGTLGIVTRAAIRLEPTPQGRATAALDVADARHALRIVRRIMAGGLRVLAAEIMWRRFAEATSTSLGFAPGQLPLASECLLAVEVGGPTFEGARLALEEALAALDAEGEDVAGIIADSITQSTRLWRVREDTDVLYRAYPNAPSYDISVPGREIDAYVARLLPALREIDPALCPYLFGHLADGNLHIVLNVAGPLPPNRQSAIEAAIYQDLRSMGGSFSAEHGVGSKRIDALQSYSDPVKVELMGQIKRLLDPCGICNPGKVIA